MKASRTLSLIIGGAIVILGIVAIVMISNKPATNTPVTTTPLTTTQTPTSNTKQPAQSNTNTTETSKVAINNFAFSPSSITVKVGEAVTWTNNGTTSHTVTADTISSDGPSSGNIANGGTYSFTFKKAGTYTYHCSIHSQMTGTVIVN